MARSCLCIAQASSRRRDGADFARDPFANVVRSEHRQLRGRSLSALSASPRRAFSLLPRGRATASGVSSDSPTSARRSRTGRPSRASAPRRRPRHSPWTAHSTARSSSRRSALPDELRSLVGSTSRRSGAGLEPRIPKEVDGCLPGLEQVRRSTSRATSPGAHARDISEIIGIPGSDRPAVAWYQELEYATADARSPQTLLRYADYFDKHAAERSLTRGTT